MVSSRHSPEQIAAFSEGEPRFIAAAYRDPERAGELFVMPDGRANALREFTREQLRCLIPDCPAPNVVAVARARRRDGFSHKAGGGRHAPESVHHRQGKAVLAQWLRGRVGHGAVTVEAASDTQRSRVADVMATFPDGARVAFEIQYASITVEEWRERHESYRAQGIVDVWLWGHTRLRRSRSSYDPPFRLDDVQDEVRRAGLRVQWFNPETGEIATAVSSPPRSRAVILIDDRFGDVMLERLSACGVTPSGIQSGTLRELTVNTATWKTHVEKLRAEAAQHKSDRDQSRQQRVERAKAIILERRAQSERSISARAAELATRAPRPQPTKSGGLLCRACGKAMDPILAAGGFHVGCEPGFWRR